MKLQNLFYILAFFSFVLITLISCNDAEDIDDEPDPVYTTCPNNKYYELVDSILPAPILFMPGIYVDHYNFACAPNMFSPNGDGINDNFFVVFVDSLTSIDLKIYSATDIMVFECTSLIPSDNITQGWNGKDLSGIDCISGKYRVQLDFQKLDGTNISDCFNIWIIRNHTDYDAFFSTENSAFPDQMHPLYGKVFPTSEPLSID
ncbi:MAG: hypothetical protein A2W91_10240 [Bacteroidetes bacterium GWF2_38_335]|nr:MAG: hypothetical protein A2W91_10240 [Bacteroidetes bacterium GWF2_38_335]OFY81913.1 MAG: hypothetical protein A2281_06800 [Bacteroidetes bacterium RIFOXYA12_FULL_38_20]HBS87996.1 hypothetical protein [Bacteroidales bacterium]